MAAAVCSAVTSGASARASKVANGQQGKNSQRVGNGGKGKGKDRKCSTAASEFIAKKECKILQRNNRLG
jgi:hypothetical protein